MEYEDGAIFEEVWNKGQLVASEKKSTGILNKGRLLVEESEETLTPEEAGLHIQRIL